VPTHFLIVAALRLWTSGQTRATSDSATHSSIYKGRKKSDGPSAFVLGRMAQKQSDEQVLQRPAKMEESDSWNGSAGDLTRGRRLASGGDVVSARKEAGQFVVGQLFDSIASVYLHGEPRTSFRHGFLRHAFCLFFFNF